MNQDELLITMQELSFIGYWDWNFKTNKIKISTSSKLIFGYSDDELSDEIDFSFMESLIYKDEGNNFLDLINNNLTEKDGNSYKVVAKYYYKGGSPIWVYSRGKIVEWDNKGEPVRMIGTHTDITEYKELEESAIKSNELLTTIINNIPQAVFWKDTESRYSGYNKSFSDLKGLQNLKDGIGKTIYELPVQTKEDSDSATKDDKEIIGNGIAKLKYIENYLTPEGNKIHVETSKVPLKDSNGKIFGLLGIFNDVTLQEKTKKNLIHVSRLYHILSHIYKLLNNLTTQQQFFDDICTSITDIGGFKLAWIGMLDDTTVTLSAFSGTSSEYLKGITVSIDPDSKSYGPTGRCIHQNKVYICNDYNTDDVVIPWRENAERYGIKSNSAFPILLKGKVIGALTVYEGVENYFNEKEVELIQEVVNTIGLGIEKIEQEKENKIAARKINQLADIIEHSTAIATIFRTSDKKMVFANNASRKVFGVNAVEDITQISVYDFICASEIENIQNIAIPLLIQTDNYIGNCECIGRNGNRVMLYAHVMVHRNEQGEPEYYSCTAVDITELNKKERELQKYADELKSLSTHLITVREEERQIIAKEIHDDLGQNLTALRLGLSWLSTHIDSDKLSLQHKFEEVTKIASETVATSRRLYNSIYPQMLEDIGIVGAIRWHSTSYTQNRNIAVDIVTDLEEICLFPEQPNLCLTLFRLYTECFSNVLWHASASKVTIAINIANGYVNLMVKDNGRGFLVENIDTVLHHGITGMRERLAAFDGRINIESEPGKGTTVKIAIPV